MQDTLIKNDALFEFIVTPQQAGMRADRLLSSYFPLYSRSYLQQLFDDNLVHINDKLVAKSANVKGKDRIRIQFPPQQEVDLKPIVEQKVDVQLLFEQEHFLVLNKPAGLVVHPPHPDSKELSLVDWIIYHYEHIARVGHIDRPGIVHRLDRNTSGIILIARTNYGRLSLAHLFKERNITKKYLALVKGHPDRHGSIELPIGRDPHDRKRMTAFKEGEIPDAVNTVVRRDDSIIRYALTHYTVKEYFKDHALVEFHPITGRTHQIRVHAAAIGHPLVGDHLYGTTTSFIDRHALHARSISFEFQGTHYSFSADPGADFMTALSHVSDHSFTPEKYLAIFAEQG